MLWMEWWPCCYLFCHQKLLIHPLCIKTTKSLVNYRIYKTLNCWRSVDAHVDTLSIQHLLPLIIVFILIWLYQSSFHTIETWPCGNAEQHNNRALFTLTRLKMRYHAKSFIAPAIHLFMNRYSQATRYHSAILYLQLKLSVKLHKAGEPLTHSVLPILPSFISPPFYCIAHPQHRFSLSLWLPCWLNQSGHVSRGAQILLQGAFRILHASVQFYIGFLIRCPIFFAVIWIIQVAVPLEQIIGVRNVFTWTVLVIFDWMMVDSPDSADIQDLSSPSREVLCRQSWWQRWSFWQFECSRTMMLKDWPGCINDLFRVRKVSYTGHLLVLSARFLLGST